MSDSDNYSDDTECVGCYRLVREGCEDTFWSSYPGLSEEIESFESTILFWDVATATESRHSLRE